MNVGDKVCPDCEYIRLATNYNYCPKCGCKLMLRKDWEEYTLKIEGIINENS